MRIFLFLILIASAHASEKNIELKLWSEFEKNPNTHALLPNNSMAGTMPSDRGFTKINLSDLKLHGAALLEAALKKAQLVDKALIILPSGEYKFSQQVQITKSNLILRGEGNTVFYFEKPLLEIAPRPNEDNGASPYAWNGGLIHIGPPEDFIAETKLSGWEAGEYIAEVIEPAAIGQNYLVLNDASKIKAKDFIFITYGNPKDYSLLNIMAGFSPEQKFNWSQEGKAWISRSLPWPVTVKSVNGNRIILSQPLRLPVEKKWGAKIQKSKALISNVGLENITIQMKPGAAETHLKEKGFNAIFFHRAKNSWVKNIKIINAENGILLNATKNISLLDVSMEGTRKMHHAFFTKNTHDALIDRFQILASVLHGLNSDMFGSGNVWSNGKMLHGTFDMHRGMQFDLIRTNIFLNNDGVAGGNKDAGPMQGKRVVNWNIRYEGKPDLVNEQSLYPQGALVNVNKVNKKNCGEKEKNCVSQHTQFTEFPNLFEKQKIAY